MLILRDWFLLVLSMVDQPAQLGVFINDKPTLLYLYRSKDRNWKDMTAQKACLKQSVFHLPGGIFIWCDLDTPFLGSLFFTTTIYEHAWDLISWYSRSHCSFPDAAPHITMKSRNMGSQWELKGATPKSIEFLLCSFFFPFEILQWTYRAPKLTACPWSLDAWETILFLSGFGLFSWIFWQLGVPQCLSTLPFHRGSVENYGVL